MGRARRRPAATPAAGWWPRWEGCQPVSFWRRLLFGSTEPDNQPLAVDDPWEALVCSQREEIVFLRAQLIKAQDQIVQMSDPLLEARVVAAERQRQAPMPTRTGNTSPPHNPQLLGLRMEREPRPVTE
jgi:hypothetical protein